MSEVRYWFRPKSYWIEILETDKNPCKCCKNLVIVTRKHWPYNPSKGNSQYCFYLGKNETVDSRLENTGWKELK